MRRGGSPNFAFFADSPAGPACAAARQPTQPGRPPPPRSHMPAALAASTPVGASSNTRQLPAAGSGAHIRAACWKMSGAGLPLDTWSPAGAVDAGGEWLERAVEGTRAASCCKARQGPRGPSTSRRTHAGPLLSPPLPRACDAVVEQRKQRAVQRGFEGVVPQVGGGRKADGHAAGVQVPQQPLCIGRAGCAEGQAQTRQCIAAHARPEEQPCGLHCGRTGPEASGCAAKTAPSALNLLQA